MKHRIFKLTQIASFFAIGLLASSCLSTPKEQILQQEKELNKNLMHKTWTLAKMLIDNEIHNFEPEHGADIYLVFGDENKLSGSTGTNYFMGNWELGTHKKNRNEITISPLGMTLMAAINETAAKFEQDIIKTFDKVMLYNLENDHLSFYNKDNELILMYIFRGETTF